MPVMWNPTKEDFETIFGGIPCTIHGVSDAYPQGQMIKVDKARAGHLINVYEKRGLAQLEFGDDQSGIQDKKGKAAVIRNKEFRERQVIAYNSDNERRKQSGQPYVEPTKQVVKYAAEIGIELISPYAVANEESKRVKKLESDNDELRNSLATLMDKMSTMMEGMTQGGNTPADGSEVKTPAQMAFTTNKNRFNKLGKETFAKFCKENAADIQAWDQELQNLVREKWAKMFPTKEFNLNAM